jgi:hypothetical protein
MLLERPESWQTAWTAYIHGSVTRPKFDHGVRGRLRDRLPPIDAAAIGPAAIGPAPVIVQAPLPEADPRRPDEDVTRPMRSEPTR